MPIDASIYGNIQTPKIESPMNMLMQGMQVQNAMNQNKLAGMQLAETERAAGADKEMARLLAGGEDVAKGLASAGYGKQSLAYAKQQREMEKEKLTSIKSQMELIGQVAGAAKDQASYTQGLSILKNAGVDISQIPPQYDPGYVKQAMMQAMDVTKQLAEVWKQKEFDRDGEKFDETKRHNRATEGLTVRGQNMTDVRAREANQNGKAPAGYRWSADGSRLEAIPGGPAEKDKAGTEGERTAAGYGLRMQEAERIIGSVAKKDPESQKPGAIEAVTGPGVIANITSNSTRQQYRQAQEDWVRAKLRKESGAVIGEDEMKREISTYFPQPGDRPDVIKQKAQARQVAMEAMNTSAGKAAIKKPGLPSSPNIDDLLKKYGG